jgi:HK97 family phage major capsid protein
MGTALDRVTILRTNIGQVTFPRLVQTAANEYGGMSFSWRLEGATKPETEPTFDQVDIVCHELSGYTEVSDRLLSRSAIDIEALLRTLGTGALRLTLDNAIINGTGVNQPLGIVNDPAIPTVARTTGGTVVYQDLVNLEHNIQEYHRGGAIWTMNDLIQRGFKLTLDGQGRPLFQASVANGTYDRFIGYPYDVSVNSPTIGNAGDIIFGNLRWYFLVMEEEVTIARSEHYCFRNNLTAFRMFLVVGGRAMGPRAITYLQGES